MYPNLMSLLHLMGKIDNSMIIIIKVPFSHAVSYSNDFGYNIGKLLQHPFQFDLQPLFTKYIINQSYLKKSIDWIFLKASN